jgi:hypothetical protein
VGFPLATYQLYKSVMAAAQESKICDYSVEEAKFIQQVNWLKLPCLSDLLTYALQLGTCGFSFEVTTRIEIPMYCGYMAQLVRHVVTECQLQRDPVKSCSACLARHEHEMNGYGSPGVLFVVADKAGCSSTLENHFVRVEVQIPLCFALDGGGCRESSRSSHLTLCDDTTIAADRRQELLKRENARNNGCVSLKVMSHTVRKVLEEATPSECRPCIPIVLDFLMLHAP